MAITILRSKVSIFFLALSMLTGAAFGVMFSMYQDLPEINALEEHRPNVVTTILAEDGQKITDLYIEKRIKVPYSAMPPNLINALLATEDTEFFNHKGIRFMSILRALLVDIRLGRMAQGGSTITQQLAKQLFLTPKKNLSRKIREALLAIQIEKIYTKKEILELYCNQIYLGSGAYGFEAAAQVYFGKSVEELSLVESALLAGLPRAPSRYSPLNNPKLAKQRRNIVLSRMRLEKLISKEEEEAASLEPVRFKEKDPKENLARYFTESVRNYLIGKYGEDRVYKEGLTVTTTLDIDMQAKAKKAVDDGLKIVANRIKLSRRYSDNATPQAALVALRPEDGAILAMVGGADYDKSKFNHVTMAKRQPGSAFKPFIYITALENGMTAADTVIDSPVSYPDPSKGGAWKPVNFSKRFYGPVTLRRALESSMNVATVKILDRVGIDPVIEMAGRLGIQSKLPPYLSLALGAAEVSPLEIVSAYATLANMGIRTAPYYIKSVRNSDGETLEEHLPDMTDAVRPVVAYTITNMLEGVIENGTGKIAKSLGMPVAGKTGTTNDFRDAWFVGYTPGLAAGVWIGFDDNRPLGPGETGGHTAGPIWTKFMAEALKHKPVKDFIAPERIVVKIIDRETGKLATNLCRDTIAEVFISGTEPLEFCQAEQRDDNRL